MNRTFRTAIVLIYDFIMYLINYVVSFIPIWIVRKLFLRLSGLKIGRHSEINIGVYFLSPYRIRIGHDCHINRKCFLDGRGSIMIGNNVSISHHVSIVTGSHDANSDDFKPLFKPVMIHDYAWIGINATILQGVTIGKGAVVAAGSIVTHDVMENEIVGGVPAKHISTRTSALNYKCRWERFFC